MLDRRPARPVTAPDDLGMRSRRVRVVAVVAGLLALLVATVPLAVGLGPVAIPPGTVASIVGHHVLGFPAAVAWSAPADGIVWTVRTPRVLLGVVVGAGLAVTGTALQAMVRNALAEPYLLGISSGASTAAAATILFGVGSSVGAGALTGSAFAGALVAAALVFAVARVGGRITSVRLLMSGVAVGYVLSAATSFLVFASDAPEGARSVLFWLLGSLSFARWSSLAASAAVVAVTIGALVLWGRRLDALAMGDDTARALGTAPNRFRVLALAVVALCVGAVVAVSGGIGFVGLVVPHVARLLVGGTHRRVVPVAALLGAVFLVWADVLARTVFDPRELPLGIVTAIVGAPLLLLLVRRMHPAAT
jgi:iron complex transport system permease protein